jgi:hypothetical protein
VSEVDVESASLPWRKSSFSGGDGCVEVSSLDMGRVALRDSKNPDKGYFVYDTHEWRSFLRAVRNGEFDDLV